MNGRTATTTTTNSLHQTVAWPRVQVKRLIQYPLDCSLESSSIGQPKSRPSFALHARFPVRQTRLVLNSSRPAISRTALESREPVGQANEFVARKPNPFRQNAARASSIIELDCMLIVSHFIVQLRLRARTFKAVACNSYPSSDILVLTDYC